MKIVSMVAALLLAATACSQKNEPVEDGGGTYSEPDVLTVDGVAPAQEINCDPNTSPGVDCACFLRLVASNWSDDTDTDISSILTLSTDDFSQESIDVLIEVALETDDKCAAHK